MVARSTGVLVGLCTLAALSLVACDDGQTNTVSRYHRSTAHAGSGASSADDGSEEATDDGTTGSSSGTSATDTTTTTSSSGAPTSSSGGTGTTPSTGTTPTQDNSVQQLCVDTINAYRAKVGAPPLTRWTGGESCADTQSTSDSQSGRAHGAFGTCKEFAQNECPGWPGPNNTMITGCLKMMWAEGPGGGHYENMKSTKYTQVSCGFHTGANGEIWSVQNFK